MKNNPPVFFKELFIFILCCLYVCLFSTCMPRVWMVVCYYVGPRSSGRRGCALIYGAIALVPLSPIHLYAYFLLTVFCDPESSCRI